MKPSATGHGDKGGEQPNSETAKVCSRADFLDGVDDRLSQPPDFMRILEAADRKSPSADSAEFVRRSLECFRLVADQQGLSPLLTELAIFDDELLQLSLEPRGSRIETSAGESSTSLPVLQFVSVLASYSEFGQDDRLMRAWHRATARVVSEERRAIVGEMDTYRFAFIWHQVGPNDEAAARREPPSPDEGISIEMVCVPDPQHASQSVTVGLPTSYSFGDETIKQIIERHRLRLTKLAPTDQPQRAAYKLIIHFLVAAAHELDESRTHALRNCLLLIVPFTRPWLYGRPDPRDPDALGDKPGGGVFMLFAAPQCSSEELESKLRKVAVGVNWFLFRAAMLEAQYTRFSTRESDLSEFCHLIARPLRIAANDAHKAHTIARKKLAGDEKLLELLACAKQSTERLETVGKIARKAVLIRSARETPYQLDTLFEKDRLQAVIEHALRDAKSIGIRDEMRRAQAQNIDHVLSWQPDDAWMIRTTEHYLDMLLYEVFRNALEHGQFDTARNKIESIVFVDRSYMLMSTSNPLTNHRAQAAVRDMFRRKRLLLGLTQIELLARTHSVPLPQFEVVGDSVVVTYVLGSSYRNGTPAGVI